MPGDAVAENASGAVRFCFYNQVVVVTDPDAARADTVAAEVLKAFHDAGYTGRVESVNALEAFLGTSARPRVPQPAAAARQHPERRRSVAGDERVARLGDQSVAALPAG